MDLKRLRELQESLEVYGELVEREGSYGRTPKAEKAFKDLYIKRHQDLFSKGGTRKSVEAARRHASRVNDPDVGHTGRKSPRPVEDGTHRRKMTQSDRDVGRQTTMYDPDDLYFGPQSDGPKGSLPKGKKLERQKKTGVSAESFNIYDILISHLLDEGYAEDVKNAYCILENMSEDWVLEILEGAYDDAYLAGEKLGHREYTGQRVTKRSALARKARNMVRNASPEDKPEVKRGLKTGWADGADGSRGSGF